MASKSSVDELPSLEEWWAGAEQREARHRELLSAHAATQLKTMGENDKLLTVEYHGYKERYPNAEVVWGSFVGDQVQIIVRGATTRKFHYYTFTNGTEEVTLKAMKIENAQKRLPKGKWELLTSK